MGRTMTRKRLLATSAIIAAFVLLVYYPALKLTFFGDDYLFIETAGRASFWQYLALYFDPRLQTAWYRPLQGMRYGLIYALFGAQPLAYHLVNVLVHICNCLLLFAIVGQIARNWRVALLTTLLYASLPLYSVAVFWPGVADFVMTLFFLAAILAWVQFRQSGKPYGYGLALLFFVLALLTKELAVTLPIVLLLFDWGLLRAPLNIRALAKHYAMFGLILAVYAPIEYSIQARGIFVNTYGYGASTAVLDNAVRYLAALAFPWMLPEPWNFFWLGGALVLGGVIVFWKKSRALWALGGIGALTLAPVVPFPWVDLRYLYVPLMVACVLFATLLDRAHTRWRARRWFTPLMLFLFTLVLWSNGQGVQAAANDFNELARVARVPFRDLSQRHPTFPPNTYLYFVDPLPQIAELSGMFFLRYGTNVTVGGNTGSARRAELRAHANAYVIWFDEERRTRELPVEKSIGTAMRPAPPLEFAAPIRLEGYELARTRITRDQAIALILYWHALSSSEEYTVTMTVVDAYGKRVAQTRHPLRRRAPDPLIVDAIVLPAAHLALGEYQLELVVEPLIHPPIILAPIQVIE